MHWKLSHRRAIPTVEMYLNRCGHAGIPLWFCHLRQPWILWFSRLVPVLLSRNNQFFTLSMWIVRAGHGKKNSHDQAEMHRLRTVRDCGGHSFLYRYKTGWFDAMMTGCSTAPIMLSIFLQMSLPLRLLQVVLMTHALCRDYYRWWTH